MLEKQSAQLRQLVWAKTGRVHAVDDDRTRELPAYHCRRHSRGNETERRLSRIVGAHDSGHGPRFDPQIQRPERRNGRSGVSIGGTHEFDRHFSPSFR